jgi:uncharacterized protein
VSDFAGLLSAAAVQRIETIIGRHEAESSDQVAVAIFSSLEGESLEDFSIQLAEKWQIGSAEHDNGVILLVFVEDRRTRIEVGYGLEGRLTDAQSGRILRDVLAPRFRAGDFDGGVEAAVSAIIAAVRGEYGVDQKPPGAPFLILMAFFFFAVMRNAPRLFWLLLLGEMLSGSRGGWSRRSRGGWGGFGGGGFGGGFGGGGFGGGGGGFGGGGASGRW